MSVWTLFYIHLGIGAVLWLPLARMCLIATEESQDGELMPDDRRLSLLLGLVMGVFWEITLVVTVGLRIERALSSSRIMTTPREAAARERAELARREAAVREAEAVLREAGVRFDGEAER